MSAANAKIIGYEIRIYETINGKRYFKSRCEYGNSPIRDRKSREAEIQRLKDENVDFEVKPIHPWVNPFAKGVSA